LAENEKDHEKTSRLDPEENNSEEKKEKTGTPGAETEEDLEEEDIEKFEELVEETIQQRQVEEGKILLGTVVKVTKEQVMVDIGDKSEGQIPISEFTSRNGTISVNEGEQVYVMIEARREEDGAVILSKDKAEKRKLWDDLEKAYYEKTPVQGTIIEKIKGGLIVDVGIKAFLPGSQIDIRPVRNPEKMIGTQDRFQIIKFNRKRGNVVVSRRILMEEEKAEMRAKTLASLHKDQIVKGRVKNITDYGAFIDLGGIDGLLHITDMSYGRIGHPQQIMSVGDEMEVKVLSFDRQTERVSLGLKQVQPDPWEHVDKKYPVGTTVQGKVVSLTDYGAFVELEPAVEGLIHVSEMTWSKKRVAPSKIVTPGDMIEAKVLDIDLLNHRISLGMKQVLPNPWDLLAEKYPPNSRIKGRIRNITNFGIFVGVEEGIDGLVHISDISWTKRIKHPSEFYKKNQEIECVVLNIDKENERFSLGIKQLEPNPWEDAIVRYRPGTDVTGRVVNITDFGVFVELEEGVEGLIHISELSRDKIKDPNEVVRVGQEIKAEILNVDVEEKKIRLSVKSLEQTEERKTVQAFQRQDGDGTSKLGEIIQKKLSQIQSEKEAERVSKPEGEKEDAEAKSTETSALKPEKQKDDESTTPEPEQTEKPAKEPAKKDKK
jgi:small subunit ribosomal protein S1